MTTRTAPEYTRADICPDCLYTDANGWNEDLIGRPFPDPAPLNRLQGYLISPETDETGYLEPGFSWSPCQGCGSTLAGDRYTVRIVQAAR
jgi:hypothetical protein